MGNLPQIQIANMRYDIATREAERSRRRSGIEFTGERGPAGVLNDHAALMTAAQARDLHRNYCQAKIILSQLQMHVIGTGNRVIFTTANEAWNEAACAWFEGAWGMECDGRDDRTIHDLNGLILLSVLREHDCIVWFDRGGIIDGVGGKIYYWETDQIASLRASDFRSFAAVIARRVGYTGDPADLQQESGVIYDRVGRPLGYIVHGGRGKTEVPMAEATILPRGPARLIKRNWRLGQRRGVADLLTCAASLIDCYEMLEAELATAKTAAHFALSIQTEDSHEVARRRTDASDGQSAAASITDEDAPALTNYRNFEKLSRGAIEYLQPGESVTVLENKRPASHMSAFIDAQSVAAGGSMGLPRVFSLMRADASFSAVRGEMNLGEVTFKVLQQFLENYVLRWEVDEAINYALATGQLPAAPVGWQTRYQFDHPRLKALDEDKQTRSDERAMRTMQKTMQDIHGPDWRKVVDQVATERAYMASLGVTMLPEIAAQPAEINEEIAV